MEVNPLRNLERTWSSIQQVLNSGYRKSTSKDGIAQLQGRRWLGPQHFCLPENHWRTGFTRSGTEWHWQNWNVVRILPISVGALATASTPTSPSFDKIVGAALPNIERSYKLGAWNMTNMSAQFSPLPHPKTNPLSGSINMWGGYHGRGFRLWGNGFNKHASRTCRYCGKKTEISPSFKYSVSMVMQEIG